MSFVKVQPDFTGGNQIEIAQKPDASGVSVDRQIVTLGTGETEYQLVDLLTGILNELRALRIQNANGMNVTYEATQNLIEQ